MARCSSALARVSTKSTTSFFVPGMPDADAHPPESVTLRRDDVAQAVVSAVTAGFLEPDRAARQIDLVVRHQHLRRRQLVETQHARHRSAAAIHEGHRLHEPQLLAADANARELGLVFAFETERAAMTPRQLVHEPEARVVARARIFGARIAEADDEFECVADMIPDNRKWGHS